MEDNINIVGSVTIDDKDLTKLNSNLNKTADSAKRLTKEESDLERKSKVTNATIKGLAGNTEDLAKVTPKLSNGLRQVSDLFKILAKTPLVAAIGLLTTGIGLLISKITLSEGAMQKLHQVFEPFSKLLDTIGSGLSVIIDKLLGVESAAGKAANGMKLMTDIGGKSIYELNAIAIGAKRANEQMMTLYDTVSKDVTPDGLDQLTESFNVSTAAVKQIQSELDGLSESLNTVNEDFTTNHKQMFTMVNGHRVMTSEYRQATEAITNEINELGKQRDQIIDNNNMVKSFIETKKQEIATDIEQQRIAKELAAQRAAAAQKARQDELRNLRNQVTATEAEYDLLYQDVTTSGKVTPEHFDALLNKYNELSDIQLKLKREELDDTSMTESQKSTIILQEIEARTKAYKEFYDKLKDDTELVPTWIEAKMIKGMDKFAKKAQEETETYIEEVNKRIEADSKWFEARSALESKSLSVTSDLFAAGAELLESSRNGEEEYFEQIKSLKIAATITSTLQASMDAYKSLEGIPYVGPMLAAAQSAAILATGAATVNQIRNTNKDTETIATRGVSPTISYNSVGMQNQTTVPTTVNNRDSSTRVTLVESDVQRAMDNRTKLAEQTRY